MFVRIGTGTVALALTLSAAGCAASPSPGSSPVTHARAATTRDPFATIDRMIAAGSTRFDRTRAMQVVGAADAGFRTRGNAAYRAALDAVRARLLDAGFVPTEPEGMSAQLASVAYEPLNNDVEIWDARAGALDVVSPAPEQLLAFDATDDTARTMLVAFGPPGEVTGELTLAAARGEHATHTPRGAIVLTDEDAGRYARGAGADAAAVLSAHLEPFNHPAQHADMVRYDTVETARRSGPLLLDVSPRVAARLRTLLAAGRVTLRVRADSTIQRGRALTLVARIHGSVPDAAPIVLAAHADEPGANDNGSGLATLAEVAGMYAGMVHDGSAPAPRRSVVFLFGTEIEAPERWMAMHSSPRPSFALALDMTGEGPATAPMLIERMPDPGTRSPRSNDAHTEWYTPPAPHVASSAHYLNALAVSVMRRVSHEWPVRDHPFEGGSDHQPFLVAGVPAVLFWHFPDEAYHTNLDRIARVDREEMARVAAGTLAIIAHAARAGADEALDTVGITERYAHARLQLEAGAHAADASDDGVLPWGRWLGDALASCRGFTIAPEPTVDAEIAAARARVDDEVNALEHPR